MGAYVEVKVPPDTRYETVTVNGHDFEIFRCWNAGQSEWYVCLVGTLPEYLEEDHPVKPGLLGRGPTEDEAQQSALAFLQETFPEWPKERLDEWKAKKAAEEEEARKAEEAKKAAKKKAMKKK